MPVPAKGNKSSAFGHTKNIRFSVLLLALLAIVLFSGLISVKYFNEEGEEESKQVVPTPKEESSKTNNQNSLLSKDRTEFSFTNPLIQPKRKRKSVNPDPSVEPNKPKIETKLESKPAVEPQVKPVIESTVKTVVEPEVKSTIKPIVKPVIESTVKPIVKPVIESTVKPIVKPVIESTVKPIVKPVIESTVKTVVEPQVKPVIESTIKPVAEPEVKSIVKPELKSIVEPELKPVIEPQVESENEDNSCFIDVDSEPEQFEPDFVLEANPTAASLLERLQTNSLLDIQDDQDKRLGVINAYLDAGVNPNELVEGNSPVLFCVRFWMLPVLKRMGKLDVSVRVRGRSIIHTLTQDLPQNENQLQRARETLVYLVTLGAEIDALAEGSLYTPIVTCIYANNWKLARLLLENGADPNLFCGKDSSPLFAAIDRKNLEFVQLILDHGGDILARHPTLHVGALHASVILGFNEALLLFLSMNPEEGREFATAILLTVKPQATQDEISSIDPTTALPYLAKIFDEEHIRNEKYRTGYNPEIFHYCQNQLLKFLKLEA